jgi:MFS family permease
MEGEAADGNARSGWAFVLRALSHRNYRLYFAGQSISLIGTWLTRVATSWLVYRLSGSALLLGFVIFCAQLPSFLLAPFGGVLVDRWDRRRLLVWTQVLGMLQSLALAALALTGTIAVWHVAVLNVVQGLINAFDLPARQVFVVEMVERREDLPNAIALNSTMFNGARLVGPSVAGVLIATVGEGSCFLLDGLSYLAVIGSLLAMRVVRRPREAHHAHVFTELREGFHYASRTPPIRALLLLLAGVGLMSAPYTVLVPVMASQVLHGGPHVLGWLMAASGLGALAGAGVLASRRSVRGLERVILLTVVLFGVGQLGVALSRGLVLSLVAMAAAGYGMMVTLAASNTVLHTIVEERMRGRVMSFYSMALLGTMPVGSLVAGTLAARIGAPATLALGGVACVGIAALFRLRLPSLHEHVRQLYARLEVLPEVASGMRAGARRTSPQES